MNQTVNNFTWVNLNNEGFYTRPAKRHHNGKDFFGIEVADLFNKLDKSAVQKSNIEIHKINKTNVLNIYFLNTNINSFVNLLGLNNQQLMFYKTTVGQLNDSYVRAVNDVSTYRYHEAIRNATKIGLNADGLHVFATPYARFFTSDPKKFSDLNNSSFEGQIPNNELWKVFKAGQEHILKRGNISKCALGYAKYILQSNTTVHEHDIDQALKFILNNNQDQNYDLEINPTQKQFFYEQLETAFNVMASKFEATAEKDFFEIVKLHNNQPIKKIIGASELQLQQFSTPITISAICQKLLLDDLKGSNQKSILEPTIGNGSLITQFIDSPFLNVVATEIDSNRVKNLQTFFNANSIESNIKVFEGDFTKIPLLNLNNHRKFDYVIANPPFGSIDREQIALISADGQPIQFPTQRLDHKILLETLNLRSDNGRSVYIIGSDSIYDKGLVKGGSKTLLNYLYDNYHVECALELDGSLYKRQGTKVNVRLLVIGEQLPQSRKYDVPDHLEIIKTETDLWKVSEEILFNRHASNQINQSNQIGSIDKETSLSIPDLNSVESTSELGFFDEVSTQTEEDNPFELYAETAAKDENIDVDPTEVKQHSLDLNLPELESSPPLSDSTFKDDNEFETEQEQETFEAKSLQVMYVPVSQVSISNSMIPSDQALLIKESQDEQIKTILLKAENNRELALAIENASGNPFDGFILHTLQYNDVASLAKAYSSEQIDALTSTILTFEHGRSYILGDQTGIGKGRTLAGILRYSLLNNERPVFFTRNAQLFSDLWRDIVDTDTARLIKNPFIFNVDGAISYNNEILYNPIKTSELVSLSEIDKSYDVIFTTYTQFSGRNQTKENLLLRSCDRSTRLLLDESHVAASGESNISYFLNVLKANTGETYYSSATSLKKAKNYNFYSDIFPTQFQGQLKSILENQPSNEILEAISMALAKDGVFMRREHDFSKLEFRTYDSPSHYQTATRELSDQLASVLSRMAYLSGDVDEKVAKINAEIKANIERSKESGWQENRLQVNSMNFASRMHNISRQIILAVTTPLVIDQALEALKENRKPVIGLENTGESLLKMLLVKDEKAISIIDDINELKGKPEFIQLLNQLSSGEISQVEYNKNPLVLNLNNLEEKLSEYNHTEKILAKPPNIADLLESMLDRLDTIQIRDRYGSVRSETIIDEKYLEFKEIIRDEIKKLPDIPLCPLDQMTIALEEKGYKVGEISGREFCLRKINNNDGVVYKVEKRTENTPVEKTKACSEFQSGKLDVMILSRSGSTGLSLHAIPVNGGNLANSDHLRQREFLTAQAPQAIDEFLQLIGRVDRKGQVSHPIISQFDTGLPIQRKFLMMHNAKLSELSANITSNRENVNKQVTDVDLLNKYGDDVAYEYLKNNRALANMLIIDVPEREDKANTDGLIKKIFNRLNFVTISMQEKIIDDLTFAYSEKIQKLNELGINPFVVKVCDWKAKTLDSQEIKTGLGISNVKNKSAFFEPAFYQRVEYESAITPLTSNDVNILVDKGTKLMTTQLAKHLDNYDPKMFDGIEIEPKDLPLSRLLKLYHEVQKVILTKELYESVKHSATQGFLKNDLDNDVFADITNRLKQNIDLDGLKSIISLNSKVFSHVAYQLEKAMIVVDFVNKLSHLADEHNSISLNFAIKTAPSLFDLKERDSFENALIRVTFPKLTSVCLASQNYEVKYTYPSLDTIKSDKLKYLIEDAITTESHHRNVGTALFLRSDTQKLSLMKVFERLEMLNNESSLFHRFDEFEPIKKVKEATLLTGNIISALTVASVSKVHSQSINYTDVNGNRQRALLMSSDIDFRTLTDKIQGLSTIQEAITYLKAIEESRENKISCKLPEFQITKSNSAGNPVLQISIKPFNSVLDNYCLLVQGNRSQIKQFSENENLFRQKNANIEKGMNLVLVGDLSQGSRSTQQTNFSFKELRAVLTHLSSEFSTVKINNIDETVLNKIREVEPSELINSLKN